MLLPQQLYRYIPKKVNEWTPHEVNTWFKANGIEISLSFSFTDQDFNGKSFLQATPDYLSQRCGVGSKIIIKKILEWLQHEYEEFNEYVEQQQTCIPPQKSIDTNRGDSNRQMECSIEKNKQNMVKNQKCEKERQKFSEAIVSLQSVKKWKNKKKVSMRGDESLVMDKKVESSINISDVSPASHQYVPKFAKFIQSSYEVCESYLQFQCVKCQNYQLNENGSQEQIFKLNESGLIGRRPSNSIFLFNDTVSRNHAEIIKKKNEYFVRDIGSRFGTFIEIKHEMIISEGDVFVFEDSYVEILAIKINKKSKTFDLKLRKTVYKKVILNLFNKKVVTIGKGQKDISFNDQSIKDNHAKIIYSEKGELCIVREEGLTFQMLKKELLYQLKDQKFIMRFGMQIVNMQIIKNYKPVLNIESLNDSQP